MEPFSQFSGWTIPSPPPSDAEKASAISGKSELQIETPPEVNIESNSLSSITLSSVPHHNALETPKLPKPSTRFLDSPQLQVSLFSDPKSPDFISSPVKQQIKYSPVQQKLYNEILKRVQNSERKSTNNIEEETARTEQEDLTRILDEDDSSINMNPIRNFDLDLFSDNTNPEFIITPRLTRLVNDELIVSDAMFVPIQEMIDEFEPQEQDNYYDYPISPKPQRFSRINIKQDEYISNSEINPILINKKGIKVTETKDILRYQSTQQKKPKKHPKLQIQPNTILSFTIANNPHKYEVMNGNISLNVNGKIWKASKGDKLLFKVNDKLQIENPTNEVIYLQHL